MDLCFADAVGWKLSAADASAERNAVLSTRDAGAALGETGNAGAALRGAAFRQNGIRHIRRAGQSSGPYFPLPAPSLEATIASLLPS